MLDPNTETKNEKEADYLDDVDAVFASIQENGKVRRPIKIGVAAVLTLALVGVTVAFTGDEEPINRGVPGLVMEAGH